MCVKGSAIVILLINNAGHHSSDSVTHGYHGLALPRASEATLYPAWSTAHLSGESFTCACQHLPATRPPHFCSSSTQRKCLLPASSSSFFLSAFLLPRPLLPPSSLYLALSSSSSLPLSPISVSLPLHSSLLLLLPLPLPILLLLFFLSYSSFRNALRVYLGLDTLKASET